MTNQNQQSGADNYVVAAKGKAWAVWCKKARGGVYIASEHRTESAANKAAARFNARERRQ